MHKKLYILLALLASSIQSITFSKSQDIGIDFMENRGQWEDSIRYKAVVPDGVLHFTDKGFYYHYASGEDLRRIEKIRDKGESIENQVVRIHNYQVNYVGAHKNLTYSADEKRDHYTNFLIGRDSSKWKGKVSSFGKVIQHNVYTGIDVALYNNGHRLKYDFIIAPGGNPQQIMLAFEGVQPELMPNGNLRIKTSVNEIIEQAPYAYQVIEGREIAVPCFFEQEGNQVTFRLPGGYDPQHTLVIDPELVFVTYSGAGDHAFGYFSFCTTYDDRGSLYAAGVPVADVWWVWPPNWPVTPGAFQTEYTTIYHPMVCINKYNPSGSDLVYSTYYGGGGPADMPHAMIVNKKGELILAGSTGSFNLPLTPGAFDSVKSGGTDMYITHFNKDCTGLIGATYMGGNTGSSINGIDMFATFGLSSASQNKISPIELALDAQDNIWVVCNTSAIDFPITANAFQSSFVQGSGSDGVVFALDPTCSELLYSSYIGGNGIDAVYGIQFNSKGHVVICGGTKSSDFPTIQGALHTTAPGTGNWDGFVAIIDPVSGSLINSTYVGTEKDDQAVAIQLDREDNVYVLGRTFGNYPLSQNVYSMPNTDLFVDKLSPDLSTSLLSTRLGNPQQAKTPFFPTAFLVDNCTNVYVTGLTTDSKIPLSDMPLTGNALQREPGNFWFCVLKPNFSELLYATYMGRVYDSTAGINGDHTHVGSNRMDPQGIVYQSLCVNSRDYPGTSPQSWQQFNQNTVGQDIVSFKFAFNLAGVEARFDAPSGQKDSGCAPYTVTFENRSSMAMDYFWDFGDGSPPVYNEPNPTHTYTKKGVFQVALFAHNDTTCITDDASYRAITVFDPEMPDITTKDTLVCSYIEELKLEVQVNKPTEHNRFLWQPAAGIISGNDRSAVIVNPNVDTLYTITVWDTIPGFCGHSIKDTIHIDYKPGNLTILNNDTLVCQGTNVQITVDGTEGYSYAWLPMEKVNSPSDQNPVITADQTMTYTVTASYPGCPDTSQSLRITVDSPIAVQFLSVPDSICTGESIAFYLQTDNTVLNLHWDFGDGTEMTSGNEGKIQHAYGTDGIMQVAMNAHFRACPDTSYTNTVYVHPLPKVDLGSDTELCLSGSPLILKNKYAADFQRYLWNTGDTTETLKVVHPGRYSLTVSSYPMGCSSSESVEVKKDCYINIPNAFTPNGDGENDYFFPRQLLSKNITQFKMQIFNRWGQLIFETSNVNGRGWDGRFNGKEQPGGVYVYRITIETDGQTEHYDGNVTLIR